MPQKTITLRVTDAQLEAIEAAKKTAASIHLGGLAAHLRKAYDAQPAEHLAWHDLSDEAKATLEWLTDPWVFNANAARMTLLIERNKPAPRGAAFVTSAVFDECVDYVKGCRDEFEVCDLKTDTIELRLKETVA